MEGFSQRFGRYDARFKQSITNRHTLWLHAVSVGEVNLCTQLIKALEPRLPNTKFIVSTTTTTGMGELHKKLPPHIAKIYYPIDRQLFVRRALSVIAPEAIVLVEAEVWPNFIWRAKALNIPLFLVNARLSDRSYRGYKRWAGLFQPLFAAFTAVGVQNEADATRVREVGCEQQELAHRVIGRQLTQPHLALGEMRAALGPEQIRRIATRAGGDLFGRHHPYGSGDCHRVMRSSGPSGPW